MIDLDGFWALTETAIRAVKVTDMPAWLVDYLQKLPATDIEDFQKRHLELRSKAYDARLWIAAYLIMRGCGDDPFVDFRDWLICQGKTIYEAALDNPDVLADIDTSNGEDGRPLLFAFGSVASEAYEAKTGSYKIPLDFAEFNDAPLRNREFINYDAHPEKLAAAFPKLYAKFKERDQRSEFEPVFKPL